MKQDYVVTAGVAGIVVGVLAFILLSLGFVQSECTAGTPFLPAVFACFQ